MEQIGLVKISMAHKQKNDSTFVWFDRYVIGKYEFMNELIIYHKHELHSLKRVYWWIVRKIFYNTV